MHLAIGNNLGFGPNLKSGSKLLPLLRREIIMMSYLSSLVQDLQHNPKLETGFIQKTDSDCDQAV
jgi:hypothetical protein